MYGITRPEQAVQIAQDVCDVLGHGSGFAVQLLVETACQETLLGQLRDPTPYGAGTGLCQIDRIAFEDIQRRTRPRYIKLIKEAFGIELALVEYRELEHSPLLAMIFCRLHYLLVPASIPRTLEERAMYWKVYYNTKAGKGEPEEYVRNAELMEGLL